MSSGRPEMPMARITPCSFSFWSAGIVSVMICMAAEFGGVCFRLDSGGRGAAHGRQLACFMSTALSMSWQMMRSMYLSPSRSSDSCTLRVTRSPEKSSDSPALYLPTCTQRQASVVSLPRRSGRCSRYPQRDLDSLATPSCCLIYHSMKEWRGTSQWHPPWCK